ncbi:hypothetical protein POJ06DRAFT_198699 [Lipomyces tetrasporus]|uniref:Ribosome biogenesis protein NSA1 n=1 Tax=Lipomyces tetrasporus TaxID=54092 RepID=A0AAD7VS50_9ASCO|nr:uncharacterized protein POJ06DRAFT_198699 [Lipomyces tetrasporus]KAJ8099309.1 hypothetical protein POJ06DRAFT_198699 [Lipomyces tetrasporus]
MKVLVAAEDSGSLKDISFPFGTNTSIQQSAQPTITTFASAGRSSYVQRMIIAKLKSGKEYICIARKGGIIQLYDINPPHALFVEWKDMMHPPDDAFVGLEYVEGKLSSCTATGKLVMRDLHSISDSTNHYYTLLGEPINAFRVHPNQPNVVAYGGKERELEVSVIDNLYRREPDSNADSESDQSSSWCIAATPTGRALSRRKLWKAKNVKNDELDLRVPVWISDIRFLDVNRDSTSDFKLVVSTRFGHVRVYETKYSRKPIVNVEVGDHPLIALSPYTSDTEIIYCDTNSTTARFNVINGRKGGHYSGAAGSILCLDSFFPDQESVSSTISTSDDSNSRESSRQSSMARTASGDVPLLATGGLDRFLRVYNLQTRELVAKVFVGTKLSAVCIVDGSSTVPSEPLSERESDEEDDRVTTDGGRKRRKALKTEDEDDEEDSVADEDASKKGRKKRVRLHDEEASDDDDEDDIDDVWNLLDVEGDEPRIKKEEDEDKVASSSSAHESVAQSSRRRRKRGPRAESSR